MYLKTHGIIYNYLGCYSIKVVYFDVLILNIIYFSHKICEMIQYTLPWISKTCMLLCTNQYHLIYNSVWNSKMDFSFSQRHCSCGLCLKLYRTKLTCSFYFVTFASLCSTDSMISDLKMQGLAPSEHSRGGSQKIQHIIFISFHVNEAQN